MPDNPCELLGNGPARGYCERDPGTGKPGNLPGGDGLLNGATTNVKTFANYLLDKVTGLLAPKNSWAPEEADSWVYAQFMWLGQHLAVAIFVCVVVVCGLTAWQGAPRLRQMGASTGWTLAAVAGMAAVPGVVLLFNQAVASAFLAMFDSNQGTLFAAIRDDLKHGADASNPLAQMIITAALCVALAFAVLVFMTRSLGILVWVCIAPLVLASLARGGDTSAVKVWAMRLLGLILAPFALILVSPFVAMVQGSLVMDAVLLVAADVLMLRMIVHGIPWFGPRIGGAVRGAVERRTTNPVVRAAVRAGSPDFYENENMPRQPRTVDTPGRAASQDKGALLGAYGIRPKQRTGRLTTDSAIDKARREAPRNQRLLEERRTARAAAATANPRPPGGGGRVAGTGPGPTPTAAPNPNRGAPPPSPPRNP
ncbi:hypothetical protein [Streptomyces sp. NPDC048340]|uniref:hypothetical protein n=1 Tax=Streptomyces sp. NPDC048340 TaxID=3365537 RepID=UPI00371D7669